MGNLQVPSGNQVLDLGIVSRMVTAINELQDDIQTKNAKVYTGTTTLPADTQTTRLAIETAHITATSDNSTGSDIISKTIKFGKAFAYPPVVTLTPVLESTGISTNSTPDISLVITSTSTSEVTFAIIFNSKLLKTSIGINAIAIGVL